MISAVFLVDVLQDVYRIDENVAQGKRQRDFDLDAALRVAAGIGDVGNVTEVLPSGPSFVQQLLDHGSGLNAPGFMAHALLKDLAFIH